MFEKAARKCLHVVLQCNTTGFEGTSWMCLNWKVGWMQFVVLGRRNGAGHAVVVRGQQIEIDLALTQDGARTLASGRVQHVHKDNRNLYLVR